MYGSLLVRLVAVYVAQTSPGRRVRRPNLERILVALRCLVVVLWPLSLPQIPQVAVDLNLWQAR